MRMVRIIRIQSERDVGAEHYISLQKSIGHVHLDHIFLGPWTSVDVAFAGGFRRVVYGA